MRQTVVGVFERPDEARAAIATLAHECFDPSRVHATRTPGLPIEPEPAPRPSRSGTLGHLRRMLGAVFDATHDTTPYARVMQRGGTVVSVDVDDQPQAVRAELAFVKTGAVDITRRPHP